MSFRSRRDRIAFEHPAIFPERLAEDHMRAWSNASGVTLLATPSITHGTLLFGLIRYNFGKALVRLFDREFLDPTVHCFARCYMCKRLVARQTETITK